MTDKLNKQTYRDFEHQISDLDIGYVFDHDDDYLYTSTYDYTDSNEQRKTLRYPYTVSESGKVTIDKAAKEEVIRDTNYEVVESTLEKKLDVVEGVVSRLLKAFQATQREEVLIKQFDEITQKVIEPLYIAAGDTDGHLDTYDLEGAENLIKAFNKGLEANTIQPAIGHRHLTKSFEIGKAWLTKEAGKLGDHNIPAGQPLVEITFKSQKAFDARMNGTLQGLSIGALNAGSEMLKGFNELLNPVRKILDFSFMHKGAHLSYTTGTGAASRINDKFLVLEKAMTGPKLTKDLEDALLEIDEEFEPLLKKLEQGSSKESPSTSAPVEEAGKGVDEKTLNKGNETNMSDKTVNPEVEALTKELADLKKALKLSKALAKYDLEEDTTEAVASVLASLDDDQSEVLTKAFDALVTRSEDEVKALKKSLDGSPEPKSELAVKIDKELGHGEDEETIEKSFDDRFNDKQKDYFDKIDKENV